MNSTDTHRYVVILAGGSGTRLWPLSRTTRPKQIVVLENQENLLELTIKRMARAQAINRCAVVTTAQYAHEIRQCMPSEMQLFIEPVARNTAPAILMSCLAIAKEDPDAIVCFAPADHMITHEDRFYQALASAYDYAEHHDAMVLMGVKPTHAATEYGYIEPVTTDPIASVARFHEKPTPTIAQRYYEQGTMVWNTGFVCARVALFLQEFAEHAPDIVAGINNYGSLASSSFDRTILEKSSRCVVVQANFGWSDVGTLDTFIAAQQSRHHIAMMGARNNTVYCPRTVVLAGVENICIIDTGDMLLVMRRDQMHHSTDIAQELQRMGLSEYI